MTVMMRGDLPSHLAPEFGECVGACALLILILPLTILVAVAIKCDSKGPILVPTKRAANGRHFTAYKFRCTLHDGSPTRLAPFLRFTGIEELPQLYNVFRGEMSCLNPRPEAPFFLG